MLRVASHRLLHFIACVETNDHSPSVFDADLIIDQCLERFHLPAFFLSERLSTATVGGVIVPPEDEQTMPPLALQKPRKRQAAWNVGDDNDGCGSRLPAVCDIW